MVELFKKEVCFAEMNILQNDIYIYIFQKHFMSSPIFENVNRNSKRVVAMQCEEKYRA